VSNLRSLIFSFGYFCATIFYGALSIPLWLTPPAVRHRIILSWTSVIIFWCRVCCGVRYEVVGLENIKDLNKPFVALSKHQSTWETLFLQSLLWPASTILKVELIKIPFFGWGLRALRPIAIDRSNPREALKQVKAQGKQRLSSGINLIIFPEGTRTAFGEKGKYARSGADIAVESQRPIVPISHNAGLFWPGKQFAKKPGTIKVVIGSPISPVGKSSKALTEEVENWIEKTQETLSPKQ
jgi:1-acyl-sn-glycerol-3-phosphate acyltransferase